MKTEVDQQLLHQAAQALDDWIVTYASDHCSQEQVRLAWHRIFNEGGGTIAYAGELRDKLMKAANIERLY